MGVGGDDNQWWMDVLENGQASAYAGFFDIDWHPPKDDLRGKVLSPVLGDHYGRLLESGEIKLAFEAGQGTFAVRYYSNRFPIDRSPIHYC
jgi:(1->4)-alpha-D-glucan 1-alpha-D-glucosylmutase